MSLRIAWTTESPSQEQTKTSLLLSVQEHSGFHTYMGQAHLEVRLQQRTCEAHTVTPQHYHPPLVLQTLVSCTRLYPNNHHRAQKQRAQQPSIPRDLLNRDGHWLKITSCMLLLQRLITAIFNSINNYF